MLNDSQWRQFNWLERLIEEKDIAGLSNKLFDTYYKLALQVAWYCDTL